MLETKRKKIKKKNVPKLHQKATAQPDALGVQAGKATGPTFQQATKESDKYLSVEKMRFREPSLDD